MSALLLRAATHLHAAAVCDRLVVDLAKQGQHGTANALRRERDESRRAGLAAYADHLATEGQP